VKLPRFAWWDYKKRCEQVAPFFVICNFQLCIAKTSTKAKEKSHVLNGGREHGSEMDEGVQMANPLHFLVSFRISFFMYNKKPPALNGQLSQEFVKNCTFANAYHRPM